jgi:ketosteroid isomerase-like protein
MSDSVEVVRGAYEAFSRGDVAAVVALASDTVQWSCPGTLPQGGDYQGKAGVQQFFEGIGAAWESLQVDLEAVGEVAAGLVVGIVHGSGLLRTGGSAEYGAAHAFTIQDGKITAFREYVDIDRALTT